MQAGLVLGLALEHGPDQNTQSGADTNPPGNSGRGEHGRTDSGADGDRNSE